MEFLGVGYQELIVILALLLVVVGPERLPTVAYQVGRAVRTMQRYARAVRDEFSDEIGYLDEQYKTLKGETDAVRASLRASQAELNAQLSTPIPALDLPPLLPAAPAAVAESPPAGSSLPDPAAFSSAPAEARPATAVPNTLIF